MHASNEFWYVKDPSPQRRSEVNEILHVKGHSGSVHWHAIAQFQLACSVWVNLENKHFVCV